MKLEFSRPIKNQVSSQSVQFGAELFHADGQTEVQADMTKLIVAFRNFANAPKKKPVAIEMPAGLHRLSRNFRGK